VLPPLRPQIVRTAAHVLSRGDRGVTHPPDMMRDFVRLGDRTRCLGVEEGRELPQAMSTTGCEIVTPFVARRSHVRSTSSVTNTTLGRRLSQSSISACGYNSGALSPPGGPTSSHRMVSVIGRSAFNSKPTRSVQKRRASSWSATYTATVPMWVIIRDSRSMSTSPTRGVRGARYLPAGAGLGLCGSRASTWASRPRARQWCSTSSTSWQYATGKMREF
jgi:hypothetical protein